MWCMCGVCVRFRGGDVEIDEVGFALLCVNSHGVQQNLSRWLRPAITGYESFEETLVDLREFFATNNAAQKLAQPNSKGGESVTGGGASPKGTILQFMSKVDKSETLTPPSKQEVTPTKKLDALGELVMYLQANMEIG